MGIFKRSIFLFYFLGFFPAQSWAASTSHSIDLDEFAQMLTTSMVQCPQKIWPDYSWKNYSFFLVEPSKNIAHKFDATQPHFTPVAATDLKTNVESFYSFFDYNGGPAQSMNMEMALQYIDQTQIFNVATHEFFHFQGQKDWVTPNGHRGNPYPAQAQPRIYRNLIYENLKKYFLTSGADQDSLKKAAFWFQKWEQNFPREVMSSTDGQEGTAYYLETMAFSLAKVGCSASDKELYSSVMNIFPAKFGGKLPFQVDAEGYYLGGLSSLILRLLENNSEFYEKAKLGKTPLQSLLAGVQPLEEEAPETLKNEYTETIQKFNQEMGAIVDDDIRGFDDPHYLRISFPQSSLTSTYGPIAFLYLENPDVGVIPMASPLRFDLSQSKIETNEEAVFFSEYKDNPCSQSIWFAVVPESEMSEKDGLYKIDNLHVKGAALGHMVVDSAQRKWLCAK